MALSANSHKWSFGRVAPKEAGWELYAEDPIFLKPSRCFSGCRQLVSADRASIEELPLGETRNNERSVRSNHNLRLA